MWSATLPEGNETKKIHDRIAPYIHGRGIDIGAGLWKLQVDASKGSSCIGIDRHEKSDIVADLNDLSFLSPESFDYVYSSHTLEDFPAHSNFTELALVSLGYHDVFVHVGDHVRIRAPNQKRVAPLVTGTFGGSDFIHSLLGGKMKA